MKKLMFILFTLTLAAFAASNTFHVTFDSNAWIGATEVKAGEYKVTVEGDKATLKAGKTVIEVPAKLETAERTFSMSGVVMKNINGKQQVEEIQIGGTKTHIVFVSAIPTGD